MTHITNANIEPALRNYFQRLVDHFFKILPMKEQSESSLNAYLDSLKFEIIGFNGLFEETDYNASVVALLAILQNFIDNPDTDLKTVRREVFHAISICNKLKDLYTN